MESAVFNPTNHSTFSRINHYVPIVPQEYNIYLYHWCYGPVSRIKVNIILLLLPGVPSACSWYVVCEIDIYKKDILFYVWI
jgi:hypothetical protein